MKNYHALGILIAATVVLVSACSMAHAAQEVKVPVDQGDKRPAVCPSPTQFNSGYIVTDEDGDGKSDTIWHVYISGNCAGWTISEDDHGTPL